LIKMEEHTSTDNQIVLRNDIAFLWNLSVDLLHSDLMIL
jgi:hypothetical protein